MTTPNYSGEQLTTIANFRTRAGELADLLETIPDGEHDQETWAVLKSDGNGHFCKTPQCALGWAVHRGLVPDARLATLVYLEGLGGNDPSTFARFADASNSPDARAMYEIPANFDAAGYADVLPVRKGKHFGWGELGEDYYGEVVAHGVFYDAGLDKYEVIKLLREYATTGEILRPTGYIYYHGEDLTIAYSPVVL